MLSLAAAVRNATYEAGVRSGACTGYGTVAAIGSEWKMWRWGTWWSERRLSSSF